MLCCLIYSNSTYYFQVEYLVSPINTKDMMKTRQRLWWALGGVFLLFCVSFVGAAYRFGWEATGFLNKSLWDWLQLLIVPLVLAIVALIFQLSNTSTERQIALQRYEQ